MCVPFVLLHRMRHAWMLYSHGVEVTIPSGDLVSPTLPRPALRFFVETLN